MEIKPEPMCVKCSQHATDRAFALALPALDRRGSSAAPLGGSAVMLFQALTVAVFQPQKKKAQLSFWRSGMNTLAPVSPTAVLAVDVRFSEDALIVRLSDGREVSVPLEWFARLRDATPEQRRNWRFIGK